MSAVCYHPITVTQLIVDTFFCFGRLDVSNKTESPKTDKKSFHSVLKKLVQRVTADHPHHVLFVLVALANGDQQNSTVSQVHNKCHFWLSIPFLECYWNFDLGFASSSDNAQNASCEEYLRWTWNLQRYAFPHWHF